MMDNEYLQKHIAVRKDDIPEQYKEYYYNTQILSSINTINILNIMNVRGYCDINDNNQIYVLSEDIARGIGLEFTRTRYDRPQSCVNTCVDTNYYQQEFILWNR